MRNAKKRPPPMGGQVLYGVSVGDDGISLTVFERRRAATAKLSVPLARQLAEMLLRVALCGQDELTKWKDCPHVDARSQSLRGAD